MRIRVWSIAVVLSLFLNVVLLYAVAFSMVDGASAEREGAAAWTAINAERAQILEMRAQFCAEGRAPTRAELVKWDSETRNPSSLIEPYDRDGLLWVRDLGVKLDARGRAVGLCPYMTWQMLDKPAQEALDAPGAQCPLEPLC